MVGHNVKDASVMDFAAICIFQDFQHSKRRMVVLWNSKIIRLIDSGYKYIGL